MAFEPGEALRTAPRLARPPRVGTRETDAVRTELAARLATLGYQADEQWFEFTTSASLGPLLLIFVGQLLVIATLSAWAISPWLGVVPALLRRGWLALGNRLVRATSAAAVISPVPPTPLRVVW